MEARILGREKVGIKILIGTPICIIGPGLDETSLGAHRRST